MFFAFKCSAGHPELREPVFGEGNFPSDRFVNSSNHQGPSIRMIGDPSNHLFPHANGCKLDILQPNHHFLGLGFRFKRSPKWTKSAPTGRVFAPREFHVETLPPQSISG